MDIEIKQKILDIEIYNLGKEYLLNLSGINSEILDNHIIFKNSFTRPTSLNDIFKRILESSQNANMHPGVIRGTIGSISNLSDLLFDFDIKKIISKYPELSKSTDLLQDLLDGFNLSKNFKINPNSIIPKLCKTIISTGIFLDQFQNSNDFYEWINKFDKDDKLRPALPMILSYEIYGIGFALSCDFLKELGYVNFGKPDVHLKDIFTALKLTPNMEDYTILKSIIRIAKNNDIYPYTVDKLFWLIGSGNFYLDKINIGSHKEEFINLAKLKYHL